MAREIDLNRFLLHMPGFSAPELKDYVFAEVSEPVAREIACLLEGKVSISKVCLTN